MQLLHDNLGERLIQLFHTAERELVISSPYVGRAVRTAQQQLKRKQLIRFDKKRWRAI
jgi:hypothetical protein